MRAARVLTSLTLAGALLSLALAQPPSVAQQDPDAIWKHFEGWVRSSLSTAVRPTKPVMAVYTDQLVAEGVPRDEAERRTQLIVNELHRKSRANSIVYWDAMFKFGGGPERPLRLLADVVRDLPAGSALDVAMGNGRNGVYLASLGWKVTGYDIAPEACRLARQRAAQMGVTLETVQAGHREFNYGVERWDLIVLSYIVADSGDLESIFGRELWDALRAGGRIVCEGNFCEPFIENAFPLKLKGFRLERYSDTEDVRDGWGGNDLKGRVVRMVVRKQP